MVGRRNRILVIMFVFVVCAYCVQLSCDANALARGNAAAGPSAAL